MDALLSHIWPRLQQWVRYELGKNVRSKFDSMDCAQDVATNLIQYLPTVEISDSATFERILVRMIQNSIRNKHDYLMARRRRMTRERPLDGTSICLDPPAQGDSPSLHAAKNERRAWVRFSLALLAPEEQELIFRHKFDGEPFVDMSNDLGLTADAVRMRYNRALSRLGGIMSRLKQGEANLMFTAEAAEDLD